MRSSINLRGRNSYILSIPCRIKSRRISQQDLVLSIIYLHHANERQRCYARSRSGIHESDGQSQREGTVLGVHLGEFAKRIREKIHADVHMVGLTLLPLKCFLGSIIKSSFSIWYFGRTDKSDYMLRCMSYRRRRLEASLPKPFVTNLWFIFFLDQVVTRRSLRYYSLCKSLITKFFFYFGDKSKINLDGNRVNTAAACFGATDNTLVFVWTGWCYAS